MTLKDQVRSPGIREIRRRDLIESIRTVAARMFSEKGYEETTLEEVCAEVGISLRTFFRHFDGKSALITTITRDLEDRVGRRVAEAPEGYSFVDAFETTFDLALGDYLHHDPDFARRQVEILRAAPAQLTAHWVGPSDTGPDAMESEIARRLALSDDDPRIPLFRGFVSICMLDAIARWSMDPAGQSVASLATTNLELARTLETGITARAQH